MVLNHQMSKLTVIFILLFIFTIVGIISVNHFNEFDEKSIPKSYNGVELIPKYAPNLNPLFIEIKNGPHQQYINEESCLKCHQMGAKIDGLPKAPKIAHIPQQMCVVCHLLPQ